MLWLCTQQQQPAHTAPLINWNATNVPSSGWDAAAWQGYCWIWPLESVMDGCWVVAEMWIAYDADGAAGPGVVVGAMGGAAETACAGCADVPAH